MTVHFTITLAGSGGNLQEAWTDAIEGFTQEPGEIPEDYEEIEED